jgi:carbohydrate kinase (thermoresistant glucokinase family)
MGVSGCGKSTLAQALAARLGWQFVEGDALHPEGNVRKMAAGMALDDADREPFLRAVADALAAGRRTGVVASCSALKRRYRDLLRQASGGPVLFVLPKLGREMLAVRLQQRPGHFMPASLLDSQLATLEWPGTDEGALTIDGGVPTAQQVEGVLQALFPTSTESPGAPA